MLVCLRSHGRVQVAHQFGESGKHLAGDLVRVASGDAVVRAHQGQASHVAPLTDEIVSSAESA